METVELQRTIRKLLAERNALLLVHYYQRSEIQEIADILGDSLALSVEAARTHADTLVFAGVHFMAESAAILSPGKTVLLPRLDAGCPLADTITREQLEAAKRQYPRAKVVTYINSSAAVKAASDICCTSANAIKIVASLTKADEVLMVPDGNLARWVARGTAKRVIPWEGFCPVHHYLSAATVDATKVRHPQAPLAAHPECTLEVLARADFVGSTAAILKFARALNAEELIIATETGIMAQLQRENPSKTFIPAGPNLVCRTMKLITLEDVLHSLTDMHHVITVPEAVAAPARLALERMLQVS